MKTKNKIPMRQCTGCREMKSKKEMIRVLKTTEEEIVLDTTEEKTDGVRICVFPENVWIRQSGIMAWNVH